MTLLKLLQKDYCLDSIHHQKLLDIRFMKSDTSLAGYCQETLLYGLSRKPYAPAHLVFIGIVTIEYTPIKVKYLSRPQNGFELNEFHDVDLITSTPVANDILDS